MNKKFFTREVKVGVMTISAVFILYFGLNFLKGTDIFSSSNNYYGTFENIGGLVPSSPVYVKGFKVGQVEEVIYDFSKKQSFVIKISVAKDIQLPKGAVIQLYDDGLMGGKAIQLVYEPIIASQSMYAPNDTLPTEVGTGLMAQLSGTLMPKIETIATQADSLIRSVRTLVENKNIEKSLNSIEKTTSDLASTSSSLKKLVNKDLPPIVSNVNDITSDFKVVSGNLKKIDYAATFASIDNTIRNLNLVSQKMNSNEGSLGLLLNNKDLYINLSNTASNADKLLIDMKANPKRYVHFSVFGSKEKTK